MADETTTAPEQPDTQTTPAAGGDGTPTPEELLASLEGKAETEAIDPEFLKKLEGIDPEKIQDKLTGKWKDALLRQADYTRKTQAVSEEKKALAETNSRLFSLLEKRLADQGLTPTVDQKAEMLQKLNEGDFSVVEGLIQRTVKEQYGPQMDLAAKTAAVQAASQQNPFVKEYEPEIAAFLAANPRFNAIASANNYSLAPEVLGAIADRIRVTRLEAQVKELSEGRDKYAAQKLKEYDARLKGLPATTARAGSTPSGIPVKEYKTFREAAEAAAEETPALFK